MPPVVVRPVVTRRERELFLHFPWRVYASNPVWVPPLLIERRATLNPARNPFLSHARAQLFLAWRGRQVVGTIAAFLDLRANRLHNECAGCFGFFEVLPDAEAAAALLQRAAQWVQARGAYVLRGPLNFSHDNDCGILLNAYDQPPTLMTSYNPPAYRDYIEQQQFEKSTDWYAYTIDRDTLGGGELTNLPPRLLRTATLAQQRSGVTIRPVRLSDFAEELQRVQHVYNSAWQQHPHFVPLDDTETDYLARSLRPVIDTDLVLVAEAEGQVVGASIALPDINQALHRMNGRLLPGGWWYLLRRRHFIDRLRFFAMGVIPTYRRRGIEAAFYFQTFRAAMQKGYQRAELSLVAEHNSAMRRSAESFGATIAKTYRVYEQSLV